MIINREFVKLSLAAKGHQCLKIRLTSGVYWVIVSCIVFTTENAVSVALLAHVWGSSGNNKQGETLRYVLRILN